MLVQFPLAPKQGYKLHHAGLVSGLTFLCGQDLQPKPFTAFSPSADIGGRGSQPLFRAPGIPQIIDFQQDMGGITRAHQLLGTGRVAFAANKGQAAIDEGFGRAARAG